MKLLFLLVALCCVAASAELIAWKMYLGSACADSDFFAVAKYPIELGCKNGAKYYVSGDDVKSSTYSTTDCTGTAGGTSTVLKLNKCTVQGQGMYTKFVTMSDTKFNTYLKGPGNMVRKQYQNSGNCDGTVMETVYISTINGKCLKTATTSAKMTWDSKESLSKNYASTDCSGTATDTRSETINTCVNETQIVTRQDGSTSVDKRSTIIIANPTSSGMRSTSLRSTMVFGIIFIASCLH